MATGIQIAGDWQIEVSHADKTALLSLSPSDIVRVEHERYATLPIFDPDASPWTKGQRLYSRDRAAGKLRKSAAGWDKVSPKPAAVISHEKRVRRADEAVLKKGIEPVKHHIYLEHVGP